MIAKNERQKDILKIIESLDITPSMYKNADEKYHALADYLSRHTDVAVDMYPQGSFAFGTVVRPMKDDKEASYDLDFICEVDLDKASITADELRALIEDAISSGDLYGGKLEVFDECFTINYAEEGGASFSIDVVPATHEVASTIRRLKGKAYRPDLLDSAIAIPILDGEKYEWITNNPKGFTEWFREINEPYKACIRSEYRRNLFESADFYDRIEDIPEGMERSSVQRTIQILKRHRDLFYKKCQELKPISAILNVLVTEIASSLDPSTGVFELLEHVLDELSESSKYYENLVYGEALLENRVIARKNRGWYIANPANPEDNLADKWNESESIPKAFFKWVKAAKGDLIDSMDRSDEEFRAITESAFGQDVVKSSWGDKYDSSIATPISSSVKPWSHR